MLLSARAGASLLALALALSSGCALEREGTGSADDLSPGTAPPDVTDGETGQRGAEHPLPDDAAVSVPTDAAPANDMGGDDDAHVPPPLAADPSLTAPAAGATAPPSMSREDDPTPTPAPPAPAPPAPPPRDATDPATAPPASDPPSTPSPPIATGLLVSSPAFASGDALPWSYACTGVVPPVRWDGGPPRTGAYTVVMRQSTASSRNTVWIVSNLSAGVRSLDEGHNSGIVRLGSPSCESPARYELTVYALEAPTPPAIGSAVVSRTTSVGFVTDQPEGVLASATLTAYR